MSETNAGETPRPLSAADVTIDRLTQIASSRAGFKQKLKATQEERDTFKSEVATLRTQLADAQKVANTDANRQRADDLAGELKTLRHRRVFDRLAMARGADADTLDALWQLSAYKVEADEPDEKALTEFVTGLTAHKVTGRFFPAPEAPPDPNAPPPKAPPKPSPAAGRGDRAPQPPPPEEPPDEKLLKDPIKSFEYFERKRKEAAAKRA